MTQFNTNILHQITRESTKSQKQNYVYILILSTCLFGYYIYPSHVHHSKSYVKL